jgi:hypothetical protein
MPGGEDKKLAVFQILRPALSVQDYAQVGPPKLTFFASDLQTSGPSSKDAD